MRIAISLTVLLGAAALVGATPQPKPVTAPPPSALDREQMGRKSGAPTAGGVDLFERIRASPYIARGRVIGAPPGGKHTFNVHVDKWLKGSGPSDLVVDFAMARPVTDKDDVEVIFMKLAPPGDAGPAGAEMYSVSAPGERYQLPEKEGAKLDTAVLDAVAKAPDEKVLAELTQLVPRISAPAAARLSLLANASDSALKAADAAASSDETNPQARAVLVSMLGSRLPVATLAKLAGQGHEEHLRIASLQALGRLAANEPARRADAVAALQAQAGDANPQIKLNVGLALADSGQAAALVPLNAVLAGTDEPLRAEAVRGLAQLSRSGNVEAYDALAKLVDDANGEVRTRAKNLLAQAGSPPQSHRRSPLMYWLIGAGLVVALLATLAARKRKPRSA